MREAMRKALVIAACLAAFLLLELASPALAEEPLGIALEGFAYPYPVHMFVTRATASGSPWPTWTCRLKVIRMTSTEGSKKQRTEETP